MTALEHELKRRKGDVMHLCSMFPRCSSCAKPGAGSSSGPDNGTLIEQTELATIAIVVTDDIPWQLDGIDIEDWSDKEVMTLKPALLK